ncbi:MAG: hypothetical protein KAF27_10810 [Porphyrobacter sp.]|nr:hypothetical protein [Porphyrobacter sp.]
MPMLDDALKTKLRDPAYLDWHLAAVRSTHVIGRADWYDSVFLRRFEVARHFLGAVNPDALGAFVAAFDQLKPPPGFKVAVLDNLFDDAVRARIVEIAREIRADNLKAGPKGEWEAKAFGRRVIWDHPFFLELQQGLVPQASELAGCELRTGYNFLSLYSGDGRCAPHMDQPYSMYTLDYCIEQSDEWPIHFSRTVEWPTVDTFRRFDADTIKQDADLAFEPYVLHPNQALFFNGSSQWHYRDSITPGGFCDLLFFHYSPAGCEKLVEPVLWRDHFDIPELGALCDLFAQEDARERALEAEAN